MDDNFQRQMNFIIDQQAKFAVDIQRLEERQEVNSRHIEANREMIRQLVDVSMSLAHHAEDTDRRIKDLMEFQAHSDRRLDALINVVDKLVRRNGGTS